MTLPAIFRLATLRIAAPRRRTALLAVGLLTALPPGGPARAPAQAVAVARDSLRLRDLQAEAVLRDPRRGQLDLLAAQGALRLRNVDAERLPTLVIGAQGQYQSDVVAIPFQLPGGDGASPPNDSYDAHLAARQPLLDPSRGPRRELERARAAESDARVRTALHALRQSVSDAYFAALRARAQRAELEAGVADLDAQLALARERVRFGTALSSEAAVLEAELLRRRQSLDELDARREAAIRVLAQLTGRPVSADDELVLPELAAEVARARSALDSLRARPEYEQFARSRDVLERQRETATARERPRVSAFARVGYGQPGLNPLARGFDEYWLGGVQLEWAPWRWGTTEREREELELQRRIVATEEAAFTESLRRGVVGDLAAMDRLERALAADEEIVALREAVLSETRLRFGEGVITSAEYVDRETDLLAARLARTAHRVELAEARARFLTLLGLEVR